MRGLAKRGTVYYAELRVPPELINKFDGKRKLRVSLKTGMKREAEKLCAAQVAEWDAAFERLRKPAPNDQLAANFASLPAERQTAIRKELEAFTGTIPAGTSVT